MPLQIVRNNIVKMPVDAIVNAANAHLLAGGGVLSDEYELLSYQKAQAATESFHADMAEEGLLERKPEGIAFVRCADGDKVVLRPDGTVARFSHESPEVMEEWPSLAQFFVDCTAAD